MVFPPKEMALKILVSFLLLFFCQWTHGQGLKLAIYDLSSEGRSIALTNEYVIDSLHLADTRPSFHPTDSVLYFTRQKEGKYEVVSFGWADKKLNVLHTASEPLYSPALTPDGKFISCIRGKKLGKFPLAGGNWVDLLNDLTLQNYLWIDENSVLTIAEGDPNTLNLVTLRPRKVVPIASHVGDALVPAKNTFAFVHKLSVDSWSVKRINADGSISIVAETLPDSEQFALLPDGKILMLQEQNLFVYTPSGGWKNPDDNSGRYSGIKTIGVNPGGDKIFLLFATP
jgi:hypothetical protein